MSEIIIECVCYNSKRDFNRFVRGIVNDNITVIDYALIKNKLIKADPYENEPHNSIIGLNIISMVKKCLADKNKPKTIVYSFYNLELETVVNFKQLINVHINSDYKIILNILNMDMVPDKNILNKFDYIKFIDND